MNNNPTPNHQINLEAKIIALALKIDGKINPEEISVVNNYIKTIELPKKEEKEFLELIKKEVQELSKYINEEFTNKQYLFNSLVENIETFEKIENNNKRNTLIQLSYDIVNADNIKTKEEQLLLDTIKRKFVK